MHQSGNSGDVTGCENFRDFCKSSAIARIFGANCAQSHLSPVLWRPLWYGRHVAYQGIDLRSDLLRKAARNLEPHP